MSKRTDVEAGKVVSSVQANVSIDPVTILTIVSTLLPILAKAFQECQSTAVAEQSTVKEYLHDRYDMNTGQFDEHLIAEVRPRTRRAARKNGERHLSVEHLDTISAASLKHAMEADDATVAAVFSDLSDEDADAEEDGSNPKIVL